MYYSSLNVDMIMHAMGERELVITIILFYNCLVN